MTSPDPLDEARQAFVRQAWVDARAALLAADADRSLDVGDLERLAIANHMLHNVDETTRAWERAHQAALRSGDLGTAVRHAFHLILSFGMRGDIAQAGGWAGRAAALAAQLGSDQVEGGYLLIPRALRLLDGGEPAAALALFEEAAASGTRFGESDLTTLGRLGRGQCLIALGHVEAGVALLDEAMLAVTSGEVMPIHAGSYGCASADLRMVDANICHGARILHTYLVRTHSVSRALRRYNGCVSGTVTPGCQRYPLRVLRTAARIRREILAETRTM